MPAAKSAEAVAEPETRYARSLDEVEEAYGSWMYDKKTKKKKFEPRDIAIAAVLLLIIAGGYFLLSQPGLTATHAAPKQAAVVATAVPQPTEEQLPVEQEPVQQQAAMPASATESANTSTDTHTAVAAPATKSAVKEKTVNTVASTTRNAEAIPAETPSKTVVDQPSESRTAQSTAAPAKGEDQKKKKLRDVFKDMFNKNKGKDKPVAQNAPAEQPRETPRTRTAPVTEERPANNRQAARRSDDGGKETTTAAAPQEAAVPLTDQVDIFSNAPGSWMMGVSGLKVTLRNRSSAALQSAAVDVLYYDQNNKLLERKTLNFSGVPAKGRQTLSAPDHKWADHVDYKLQSVTAKDDRYARG